MGGADEPVDGPGDDARNSRRDLLKKGAVGGAIVWATPTVLSQAAAFASPPGPPEPPEPPQCQFSVETYWDNVVWPGPINYFTYGLVVPGAGVPIPGNGWIGNNVDVNRPSFLPHPVWTTGHQWVDLVGINDAGSMTQTFNLPCPGTYHLQFPFGRYQVVGPNPFSITINVTGFPPIVLSQASMPAPNQPYATFSHDYALPAGPVTIVIGGTGYSNRGPAIGNISFWRTGP